MRAIAQRSKKALAGALLVAAGLFCVPATAPAQDASSPSLSEPAADIAEEKLDAAAAAAKRVASIKQDYIRQIEGASSTDKPRLVAQANDELAKAVTDQGLSIVEYATILKMAKNNPDIREKIIQRIGPIGQKE